MSGRDPYTIIDAIKEPRLFGGAFKNISTWQSWLAFLSALFALPMDEAQAAVWRECTGRQNLPKKPFAETWICCGRRSGKSFMMALLGTYLACFRSYKEFLGPGEKASVVLVAADRKQAKIVLRFVKGLLKVPVLAQRVLADRLMVLSLRVIRLLK
jgi:hypothetical protein